MSRLLLATMMLAPLLSAPSGGAQAADPHFCADYARAALSQVQTAQRTPSCAPNLQTSRWATTYQAQFTWCTTVTSDAATKERQTRTAYLMACRGM